MVVAQLNNASLHLHGYYLVEGAQSISLDALRKRRAPSHLGNNRMAHRQWFAVFISDTLSLSQNETIVIDESYASSFSREIMHVCDCYNLSSLSERDDTSYADNAAYYASYLRSVDCSYSALRTMQSMHWFHSITMHWCIVLYSFYQKWSVLNWCTHCISSTFRCDTSMHHIY